MSESDSEDQIFKTNLEKKFNLRDVKFRGVDRTNRTILQHIVAEAIKTGTLPELVESKISISEKLKSLGAFSNIDAKLVYESDDNFDLQITVKERRRLGGMFKTEIDSKSYYSHGHLSIQANLPNLNGIGDSLSFTSKFNKHRNVFEARYSVPIVPWRKYFAPRYSLSFDVNSWDKTPSSFDIKNTALTNQVDFRSSDSLNHTFIVENVWRQIKSSSDNTPLKIRELSSHSLKQSIKYVLTYDTRIFAGFPVDGNFFRISNEVTTNFIQNSVKFTKHEINLQINKSVSPKSDILCQFNLSAGLMSPTKVNICDKFFLGDPLNFRGFKINGVGPSIQSCPLGGDTYILSGLHLLPPMPCNRDISAYIRPQLFINAGTIGSWKDFRLIFRLDDIGKDLVNFRNSIRYTCGIGLVVLLGPARLELNYCYPLVKQSGDLFSEIQFGIGVNV